MERGNRGPAGPDDATPPPTGGPERPGFSGGDPGPTIAGGGPSTIAGGPSPIDTAGWPPEAVEYGDDGWWTDADGYGYPPGYKPPPPGLPSGGPGDQEFFELDDGRTGWWANNADGGRRIAILDEQGEVAEFWGTEGQYREGDGNSLYPDGTVGTTGWTPDLTGEEHVRTTEHEIPSDGGSYTVEDQQLSGIDMATGESYTGRTVKNPNGAGMEYTERLYSDGTVERVLDGGPGGHPEGVRSSKGGTEYLVPGESEMGGEHKWVPDHELSDADRARYRNATRDIPQLGSKHWDEIDPDG